MPDWITEYIKATEKVPSPEIFRLWSAITAISGVLERKVWTSGSAGPIYPNLFTLLVGPPAAGKTNAIRPIREIWAKVTGMHLAPDNVTKAALIDSLAKSLRTVVNGTASAHTFCAMSLAVSEFGVFFTHHDLEFLSVLNNIFDGPIAYREERRTVGVVEVIKPNLVMLAGTQPDYLNTFLPETAWGMGFTSRLIMIYAPKAPNRDLFSTVAETSSTLIPQLVERFKTKGEFVWSKQAIDELNAWNNSDCPPTPDHSKLYWYNGRRALNAIKLSMISSVSRDPELYVTLEDFERSKEWLLEAEKVMPDIFRAMGQKSDAQVIRDLHFFIYKQWSSVALNQRRPVEEKVMYDFLHQRVTSDKIARIIEIGARVGYWRQGTYPGEWVPEDITKVAKYAV